MKAVIGVCAVLACAGSALADINSINALNFNTYEDFRNPTAVIPSTLTLNGGPAIAPVYNTSQPAPLAGPHDVREVYPAITPGFANRHIMWASNDGGATAYQLQANESFRVRACFRTNTNHPTGIGAPFNSETGFWIHNPRVNEEGVHFIDEGGLWLITNGTSFTGGASSDFFLYGEGGFNNPSAPPIYGNNDLVEMEYIYHAPGDLYPGSRAAYEASVFNVAQNRLVQSGVRLFNGIAALGEDGLNPGTTFGFRVQNQVDPAIQTDTTTSIFNISIAVPAPGSFALLGLGGLVATRRRR